MSYSLSFSFYFLKTAAAAAKSLQSCPTLCDPIDGSPPGSLVPGILQARTLEWVAISFSTLKDWAQINQSGSARAVVILPPRRHLAMCGGIFERHNLGRFLLACSR